MRTGLTPSVAANEGTVIPAAVRVTGPDTATSTVPTRPFPGRHHAVSGTGPATVLLVVT